MSVREKFIYWLSNTLQKIGLLENKWKNKCPCAACQPDSGYDIDCIRAKQWK